MLMDNSIIQSLWIGETFSNNEQMCLSSYLHHGHSFHLYTYDEIKGVPRGITLCDANEIIPFSRLFKDSARSYASFADWFRLRLLFLKGGWWVDMDTVCIRPFDIQEPLCFSSERHYALQQDEINNTYIKAPACEPHIGKLLQLVEEKLQDGQPVAWGGIGVYLLRRLLPEHPDFRRYIQPPPVFCPLDWFNLSALICPNDYRPGPETLAIHLWNEVWRRGCLDKNAVYHPDSLYEILKKRYLRGE